jgi:hypothetical protein
VRRWRREGRRIWIRGCGNLADNPREEVEVDALAQQVVALLLREVDGTRVADSEAHAKLLDVRCGDG